MSRCEITEVCFAITTIFFRAKIRISLDNRNMQRDISCRKPIVFKENHLCQPLFSQANVRIQVLSICNKMSHKVGKERAKKRAQPVLPNRNIGNRFVRTAPLSSLCNQQNPNASCRMSSSADNVGHQKSTAPDHAHTNSPASPTHGAMPYLHSST